jgi:hypothetical protein
MKSAYTLRANSQAPDTMLNIQSAVLLLAGIPECDTQWNKCSCMVPI